MKSARIVSATLAATALLSSLFPAAAQMPPYGNVIEVKVDTNAAPYIVAVKGGGYGWVHQNIGKGNGLSYRQYLPDGTLTVTIEFQAASAMITVVTATVTARGGGTPGADITQCDGYVTTRPSTGDLDLLQRYKITRSPGGSLTNTCAIELRVMS